MEAITPKKEWTVAIRYNHWIMAFSIFVLIVTGFYIANPFTILTGETVYKFFMGDMRVVHVFFGIILTFIFVWRIYLAFFSKFHADWKDFFAWTNIPNTIKQVKFYALVSKEPAEHTHLYGPLQSIAYAGLLFLVFLIVLTGLILMGAGYHAGWTAIVYGIVKPFETIMGGLAIVRLIHHILTWCFVLFIIAHVYMAFWYDVVFKEGTVSSMISGMVFRKNH
ncbi:MAG: Ni/Fe-hydrogenase 1 B-type cytochrome subunit [Syntrophus sp. SKADARSKE-3]|nr:Ni/Fe-hydrogenase 1 B-type cytochrome subunit [Syntrophus sp. SKADARSKE-3]